jgi:hypothetical protein
VSRTLLPLPQYRGIGSRRFFELANDRMWGDLVVLSDRTWGWGDDYRVLRAAAIEAIRRHPGRYVSDVAGAMRFELEASYSWPAPVAARRPPPSAATSTAGPAEPGGAFWWLSSTPDGRIRNGPHGLLFGGRVEQRHYDRLVSSVSALEDDLPNRDGSRGLARILNGVGRVYPRAIVWLLLGLAALLVRRPHTWRGLIVPPALALTVLLGTMAGLPSVLEYRVPFDPIFVLFGCSALLGARVRRSVDAHDVVSEFDRQPEA